MASRFPHAGAPLDFPRRAPGAPTGARALVRLALLGICAAAAVSAQSVVVNVDELDVPEAGFATLQVRLDAAPAGNVAVDVTRVSGDADLATSTVVLFELNVGASYKIALFDSVTPLTVANLLNYVRDGDYDGTIIHRAVPGFVIQGGGYLPNATAPQHIPVDPPVANEFRLPNLRGTVAMAKSGDSPNSATSEWFVNLGDSAANPAAYLDFQNGGFTVFGEVIENGMALMDAIADQKLLDYGQGSPFRSLPYVQDSEGNNYFIMVNRASVVSSAQLTFTPENWDASQTVTFHAVPDDDLLDGTAVYRCQGPGGSVDIDLTEDDDDRFLILVSSSAPQVPEGGTSVLSVRLSQKPPTTVTVAVDYVGGDPDLSVAAGETLTFSRTNWQTDKPVTLAAAIDQDIEAGSGRFRLSVDQAPTVYVTAEETDTTVRVIATPAPLAVGEGGTRDLELSLSAPPPAGTVTVTVSKQSGDVDLTVQGTTTVTFGTGDWATPQPVTLHAAQDVDVANGSATFRCEGPDLWPVSVQVSEEDDDKLAIVVDPPTLSVPEGGGASIGVRLSHRPTLAVDVLASLSEADADFALQARAILGFTPDDWGERRLLQVTAGEDDDDDIHGTGVLRLAFGATADPVAAAGIDVGLREVDDDVRVTVGAVGPGSSDPEGERLVDTNAVPFIVRGIPEAGSVFYQWTSSGGVAAVTPRLSETVVRLEGPGTLTAHFSADTDADGMPDDWEDEVAALDPDDTVEGREELVPGEDLDGDGFSNRDELLNGTSPLRYVISLEEGWNLLGFAHEPLDNRPSAVLRSSGLGGVVLGPTWEWNTDARGRAFAEATVLVPNRGYWVHAVAAADVTVTPRAEPPSLTVQLVAGWNLIAIPLKPADNSVAGVFGDAIVGAVWEFRSGAFRRASHLVPLRGYWVYARQPALIHFVWP